MPEKPTFVKLAELTLENAKKPLTPVEIWEQSEPIRKSMTFASQGKTPWRSIGAQIYVDIRDNPNSIFYQHRSHPVRFFLKKYRTSVSETPDEPQGAPAAESFQERDIHPLLVRFLYGNEHFRAKALTIYHEESSRKPRGYNEWLHPDLVGVYYPFEDFSSEVLNVQKYLGLTSLKIFSFEVKKTINLGNLRESYFQAVSNSSWANEGYLVTIRLGVEPDLRDELRRLNNAFGIGVIELNLVEIDQSEIVFPAKVNSQLDWNTINRLLEENKHFKSLLGNIYDSLQIHKVTGTYDKVLDLDELTRYSKSKNIAKT